jgi:hypothetical protein
MVETKCRFGLMVLWPTSQPSGSGLITATQGRCDAPVR